MRRFLVRKSETVIASSRHYYCVKFIRWKILILSLVGSWIVDLETYVDRVKTESFFKVVWMIWKNF